MISARIRDAAGDSKRREDLFARAASFQRRETRAADGRGGLSTAQESLGSKRRARRRWRPMRLLPPSCACRAVRRARELVKSGRARGVVAARDPCSTDAIRARCRAAERQMTPERNGTRTSSRVLAPCEKIGHDAAACRNRLGSARLPTSVPSEVGLTYALSSRRRRRRRGSSRGRRGLHDWPTSDHARRLALPRAHRTRTCALCSRRLPRRARVARRADRGEHA